MLREWLSADESNKVNYWILSILLSISNINRKREKYDRVLKFARVPDSPEQANYYQRWMAIKICRTRVKRCRTCRVKSVIT